MDRWSDSSPGEGLRLLPPVGTASERFDPPALSVLPGGLAVEADTLWHVTITVAGPAADPDEVRDALERLALEHPFLLSAGYAADRAEVRYWEEAPDVHDALALALRLWGEHRASAGLPAWSVVGLEVVDRTTHRTRDDSPLHAPGVRPFDNAPF